MFSGIVETTGIIQSIHIADQIKQFAFYAPMLTHDLQIGASIAVNGVCLTVVRFNHDEFSVDVVPETLRCTNLGELSVGDHVNLERSMKADQRIGGHFVQGHVDTTCEIISIKSEGTALLATLSLPAQCNPYLVNKGYVTLDGMSITVIEAAKDYFTVTFIPHTQFATIVQHYRVGQRVNLEVDMMAKYAIKTMETYYGKN